MWMVSESRRMEHGFPHAANAIAHDKTGFADLVSESRRMEHGFPPQPNRIRNIKLNNLCVSESRRMEHGFPRLLSIVQTIAGKEVSESRRMEHGFPPMIDSFNPASEDMFQNPEGWSMGSHRNQLTHGRLLTGLEVSESRRMGYGFPRGVSSIQ